MSLLCLVLFIMPCGRSYLWLIILKQFLYFISVEFPLEDATKEANHANKAYPGRGTEQKKQIMLLHICRNVKITWAATIHVPFFFFSPEWMEMIHSHSCCTSVLSLTRRIRESVSRLGAGNWNSALCTFFFFATPESLFLLNCPAGSQYQSWDITPQNCQLIK